MLGYLRRVLLGLFIVIANSSFAASTSESEVKPQVGYADSYLSSVYLADAWSFLGRSVLSMVAMAVIHEANPPCLGRGRQAAWLAASGVEGLSNRMIVLLTNGLVYALTLHFSGAKKVSISSALKSASLMSSIHMIEKMPFALAQSLGSYLTFCQSPARMGKGACRPINPYGFIRNLLINALLMQLVTAS